MQTMTSWTKINPIMPALCFTDKFAYYAQSKCRRMCACLTMLGDQYAVLSSTRAGGATLPWIYGHTLNGQQTDTDILRTRLCGTHSGFPQFPNQRQANTYLDYRKVPNKGTVRLLLFDSTCSVAAVLSWTLLLVMGSYGYIQPLTI